MMEEEAGRPRNHWGITFGIRLVNDPDYTDQAIRLAVFLDWCSKRREESVRHAIPGWRLAIELDWSEARALSTATELAERGWIAIRYGPQWERSAYDTRESILYDLHYEIKMQEGEGGKSDDKVEKG